MSLKMVPSESLVRFHIRIPYYTALSCIVSEIEILTENRDFFIPLQFAFDAHVRESPSEYRRTV